MSQVSQHMRYPMLSMIYLLFGYLLYYVLFNSYCTSTLTNVLEGKLV